MYNIYKDIARITGNAEAKPEKHPLKESQLTYPASSHTSRNQKSELKI